MKIRVTFFLYLAMYYYIIHSITEHVMNKQKPSGFVHSLLIYIAKL